GVVIGGGSGVIVGGCGRDGVAIGGHSGGGSSVADVGCGGTILSSIHCIWHSAVVVGAGGSGVVIGGGSGVIVGGCGRDGVAIGGHSGGGSSVVDVGCGDVYQYISEDVVHKHRRLLHNQNVVFRDQEVQNYTLLELKAILNVNNKLFLDFPKLPQIDYMLINISRNRLIAVERMYNANEELSRFTSLYGGLNPQQRDVCDNIMQAVNERNGGLFFMYGCGVNKSSSFWDYCKVFVLSINMRLHDPTLDVTFADAIMRFHNLLIAMGDGRLPSIALDGEDDATWITILKTF
nr:replication factor A protein 1 [Tanacetum cinerariifolium]